MTLETIRFLAFFYLMEMLMEIYESTYLE
jgi:hypothetical protein